MLSLESLKNVQDEVNNKLTPAVEMNIDKGLPENLVRYLVIIQLQELSSSINKALNKLEPIVAARVAREMEQSGMDVVEANGFRFRPAKKDYINVSADNKERLIAWMQQHPVGKELVRLDIHQASLKKFIEDHILPFGAELPPGVNMFSAETLSVRKAKQ